MLGGFLREWQQRKSVNIEDQRFFVADFLQTTRKGCTPAELEKKLADIEVLAAGRLAKLSFFVRVGPILGLMGTLIPMGPALHGLSTGNIESMAQNLTIVFSTTVIGVYIGGVCYGILLARRQWYASDLAEIEALCRKRIAKQESESNLLMSEV